METRVLTSAIKTSKEILMKLTWVTNDPSSIRRTVNNKAAGLQAQLVKNPPATPGLERSAGEGIGYPHQYSWASLVAQMVKNLPAMWETWVQSLGWEDPLEKETATRPSILPWRIPWTEKSGMLQFMGLQSQTWLSNFHCQWKQGAVSQNLPPYDDADWTLSQILNAYAKHERTNFTVLRNPDVFIIKFSTTATLL